MKKVMLCAALSIACSAGLMAESYVVDASHSSVEFGVKHMSVSNVKGSFDKFSGSVELDGKTITKLDGEVQIASINTNSEARDKHLNAPDFFDAKKFDKATLSLVKHSGKKLEANVTIRGITKKVTFDVELNGPVKHPKTGKDVIALSLEGKLNRKDFNVGADTANAMVSDNVNVKIELEAAQK
ncbi:polyisoprenoid-binding protein [Helicobacter jaachi]|uniref:Polyisoprenoid-binding protein n=1 Tax=Helicobacter jaachi TaxID=1677920 RepID=A0A4U8TET3_9HELI|nr:YceI family protein [Helicobacter jaachi]TLD97217.1 polyisoprenoid-binding protein [Helicobacter jaachi]